MPTGDEDAATAEEPIARPEAEPGEPTPATRSRSPEPRGPKLTVRGHEWRLRHAGLARIVDEVRDRMYDETLIRRNVQLKDCRLVAFFALHSNYRLTNDEAAAIVHGADHQEIADAAMECLFPVGIRRTFTSWARSGLIANGIDPDKVEAEELPLILRHLTATDRLEGLETFTEADEYMGVRRGFLGSGA